MSEFKIADFGFWIELRGARSDAKSEILKFEIRNHNMHHLLEIWLGWVLTLAATLASLF